MNFFNQMFQWDFMRLAFLAILFMAPLFGILSTMIVTGKMSFFSDALGHSAFTGIAIGSLCGLAFPIWAAVALSVVFALLFTAIRQRTTQSSDTIIGVFSSTAVALGIFIATMGGGSFTKFNRYLIGDILSVTPMEIGLLAGCLALILLFWIFCGNKLVLSTVHPQLASSRGISVTRYQGAFTVAIAVVVTLGISWVGLMVINSLLILPGAAARNISKNLRQYHLFSVILALCASFLGLITAYALDCSVGAVISLYLALFFAVTFLFRKKSA